MSDEKTQATTTSTGLHNHCCQKRSAMGTAALEPNAGPLKDRSETSTEGSVTESADFCFDQDGSNGSCRSVASMAGRSPEKKAENEMSDLLDKARETCVERGKDYGHPFHDFTKIAKIWSVIFETTVTPEQVALAMIGVKMARICQNSDFYHEDSVLDICGYASCLEKVANFPKGNRVDPYPEVDDIFDA